MSVAPGDEEQRSHGLSSGGQDRLQGLHQPRSGRPAGVCRRHGRAVRPAGSCDGQGHPGSLPGRPSGGGRTIVVSRGKEL